MNYRIYINGMLYSEYEETQHGFDLAYSEFNNLKHRHRKDNKEITLYGIYGDKLDWTEKKRR